MAEPKRFFDTVKSFFWWYIAYPIFPYLQNMLVALHIIHHDGRQPWHIGWLRPERTLKEFAAHAGQYGFGNHFIAWKDSGQVLGLRKHEGVRFQYHLRVFRDGEICGHYEETPEADPAGHFSEKVFEPRTEQFRQWLGDWVSDAPSSRAREIPGERIQAREDEILVPGNTISQSDPAASRGRPENG